MGEVTGQASHHPSYSSFVVVLDFPAGFENDDEDDSKHRAGDPLQDFFNRIDFPPSTYVASGSANAGQQLPPRPVHEAVAAGDSLHHDPPGGGAPPASR